MNKTTQILLGAACIVVILGGLWTAYASYTAHQKAEEQKELSERIRHSRMRAYCRQFAADNVALTGLLADTCADIEEQDQQ